MGGDDRNHLSVLDRFNGTSTTPVLRRMEATRFEMEISIFI